MTIFWSSYTYKHLKSLICVASGNRGKLWLWFLFKMRKQNIRLDASGDQNGEEGGTNSDHSNNHIMPPGRGVGVVFSLCHWTVCPQSCQAGLRISSSLPDATRTQPLTFLVCYPALWFLKSETDAKTRVIHKLCDRASDFPRPGESTSKSTHMYGC